jgi:DNA topoisomerase VI subunit A
MNATNKNEGHKMFTNQKNEITVTVVTTDAIIECVQNMKSSGVIETKYSGKQIALLARQYKVDSITNLLNVIQ